LKIKNNYSQAGMGKEQAFLFVSIVVVTSEKQINPAPLISVMAHKTNC